MLLLEFRTPAMPVPELLNQSERTVPELQQEELEAEGRGIGFDGHEGNSFIYAVGPVGREKDELYAVAISGAPRGATNRAFVTTARRLLSFDRKAEPYPQTNRLDYDPKAGPPRPAVVRALTKELTKNNGSGASLPTMICV